MLCLLVSIGFQVLFHSPPGVLFTFPSRYYTLSVTWSYLAFGDGPPSFRQDSSCPDVLWILARLFAFSCTGLLPSLADLSKSIPLTLFHLLQVLTRFVFLQIVWALPISLATTFGIAFCFLFLRVIRCFSSPGSPRMTIYSSYDTITLLMVSSLIRISTAISFMCNLP